jgi:CIC family chloride channel protein
MTGGYGLVLPLMIANMSAFALARYWRHTPVYEALLAQDGIYLPHGNRPRGPQEPAGASVPELTEDDATA